MDIYHPAAGEYRRAFGLTPMTSYVPASRLLNLLVVTCWIIRFATVRKAARRRRYLTCPQLHRRDNGLRCGARDSVAYPDERFYRRGQM